ncbi:MAG: hypothetical protein IJN62_03075 [Clostridia bacterium]|nr:hypothetical protein [Clostridia bacterium]
MSEKTFEISQNGVSGNISINIDDVIEVDMQLALDFPLPETDVIKLNLISSTTPDTIINCGTAEMTDNTFHLNKVINTSEQFDTAEIVHKNVFTEEVISLARVCFAEEVPDNTDDISEIKNKLLYLEQNPAYISYLSVAEELKSPIENAMDALENLHRTLSKGNMPDTQKNIMAGIRSAMSKYETVTHNMPIEFIWHRVTSIEPPADITCFNHIIYTPDVLTCFARYGHYLLGIKKGDDVICFAIPTEHNAPNPISHIDDCAVYIRPDGLKFEYCTVCVSLEPDGQYFMPICE